MHSSRISKLSKKLKETDIDWLALVPNTSMVYLTGIHSHMSERPFVIFVSNTGQRAAIVPILEAMKARDAGIADDCIFAWGDSEGYLGAFGQAVQTLGLSNKTVGVEARYMRVLEADVLTEMGKGIRLVHADDVVNDLRLRKDADEIRGMQRAVDIAETAFKAYFPQIKVGMTEKEIAKGLVQAMNEAGADAMTFSPIVSAGANGASPHAVPTDRPIEAGDLLIIDWGAQAGDYVSDITRTFAVGDVSEQARAMYDAVLVANRAGVAACKPLVSCHEIDQAARQAIEAAGFGEYFIHRTGHGLGMEAHEAPSLASGNHKQLPVGAAFTVEPGVYVPDVGGVRIEDDVVLTENGHVCLTSLTRELVTVE